MDKIWQSVWIGLLSFTSVAVVGGVAAAALVYFWPNIRRRWLPVPHLRWGRWTGGEVLAVYLIMQLAPALIAKLLDRIDFFHLIYGQRPSGAVEFLWVETFSFPLFVFLSFTVLYLMSRTYFNDLGLSRSRWQANCVLGYVGFVLATPVVLGLFAGLENLPTIVGEPRRNPLTQVISEINTPFDRSLFVVVVCVMVPIVEELVFRGVIQGWLRRASLNGYVLLLVLVLIFSTLFALPDDNGTLLRNIQWQRVLFPALLAGGYLVMLRSCERMGLFLSEEDFLPPPENKEHDPDLESPANDGGEASESRQPTPAQILAAARWKVHDVRQQRGKIRLTIFGSAMVFALAHSVMWPDPIPLFVLGLVLGWLAQRTQNLLPGIVLHALFNGVATAILFLG